jgi:hypothetical protein
MSLITVLQEYRTNPQIRAIWLYSTAESYVQT